MKKTIIITHGNFGRELIKSVEMIIGECLATHSFSLNIGDSPDLLRCKLEKLITDNEQIYIFTDIMGGTPFNISAGFLEHKNVSVITGVNLPLLLEHFTNISTDVHVLVEKGKMSIISFDSII